MGYKNGKDRGFIGCFSVAAIGPNKLNVGTKAMFGHCTSTVFLIPKHFT